MNVGEKIGPYDVLERVGRGGMGEVFRGVAPSGEDVAIKVIHPHLVSDENRDRLGREAASIQRVEHSAVAQVLDYDVDSDCPYIITEFVDGPTLEHRVKEGGPLSRPELAVLGSQLGEALAATHAAGVVHRDVKPTNIMLRRGSPVLIDFGVAHLADATRITQTGLVMGTPGYLAPEILAHHAITPATDWWGWAATVTFASTGRHPFGGGPVDVVLARLHSGVIDTEGAPEELVGVLRGALTVDQAKRPVPAELRVAMEQLSQACIDEGADLSTTVLGIASGSATGDNTPVVATSLPGGATSAGATDAGATETLATDVLGAEALREGGTEVLPSRATETVGTDAGATEVLAAEAGVTEAPREGGTEVLNAPTTSRSPKSEAPADATALLDADATTLLGDHATTVLPAEPEPQYHVVDPETLSGSRVYNPADAPTSRMKQNTSERTASLPTSAAGGVDTAQTLLSEDPDAVEDAPDTWMERWWRRAVLEPGRSILLTAFAAALAAVGVVSPVTALTIGVVWAIAALTVTSSVRALSRRRSEYGGRRSDVTVVSLGVPMRLVVACLRLVFPVLLAIGLALLAGAATDFLVTAVRPHRAATAAAIAAVCVAILAMWRGSVGPDLRFGSRAMMRAMSSGPFGSVFVLGLFVLVALSGLMVIIPADFQVTWTPFEESPWREIGNVTRQLERFN